MPIDRRRAWVIVAIMASMAVVAVASRAGVDDGRARSAETLAGVVATVVQAAVLVWAVVMLGVVVWLFLPGAGPRAERRPRRPFWTTVLGFVLAIVVLWLVGPFRPPTFGSAADRPAPEESPAVPRGTSDGDGDRDPVAWGLGAAGLALIALASGAVVLAGRRRPAPPAPPERPAPLVTAPDTSDDLVDAVRACRDPRQAVLLAFAAVETILSSDHTRRRPPSTSAREWAASVRSDPLTALVGRYEVARFSDHAVTDDDRAVALDALERLR